jgi:hypothetical protein
VLLSQITEHLDGLAVVPRKRFRERNPAAQAFAQYAPAFDPGELTESYRSRRFLSVFQQAICPGSPATGEELHGLDSLGVESSVFISLARVSLESLSLRTRHYRTALIPRAEQAHRARLEAYKTGRLDFPAVVESMRELSDLRTEYQFRPRAIATSMSALGIWVSFYAPSC